MRATHCEYIEKRGGKYYSHFPIDRQPANFNLLFNVTSVWREELCVAFHAFVKVSRPTVMKRTTWLLCAINDTHSLTQKKTKKNRSYAWRENGRIEGSLSTAKFNSIYMAERVVWASGLCPRRAYLYTYCINFLACVCVSVCPYLVQNETCHERRSHPQWLFNV